MNINQLKLQSIHLLSGNIEMRIIFRIERYKAEVFSKPFLKDYTIEVQEGETVLDCLMRVKEELDPSLTFRRSCRSAICGSCGMNINGVNRLACYTQVSSIGSSLIILRPLPNLPRIRDLVVDIEPFMEKYRQVKPFLVPKTPPPEKEYRQSVKERKLLDEIINCIMCGCCSTSCPISWLNKSYLGPAAFGKVYRFLIDSRDTQKKEWLKRIDNQQKGIWRCHHIFNCLEACPKKIDLPWVINQLRKE